tara:strand:+ start:15497 stop:16582 length:1086 start_codon:yes stop_codon:yes gene_type:complete
MKSIIAAILFVSTLTFAETAPEDQAAVQSMEMANECFGIKAKPFSTYQKFYFKADGIAYGLKNGQEVKLKYDDTLKKLNADGTIDYQQSLQNFKNASGISPQVCKADAPAEPGASSPTTPPAPVAPNSCNTLSEMDSVVLAMSWQPAFCEEKRSKPECKLAQFLATDSYQASNFTLHGMWPNKNSCGQNYGFCGDVKSNQSDFCNYPEVNIANQSTEKDLESVMPSRAAGSCLERHEWHKHGTCQTLDAAKYFDRAIILLKDFNHSKAGDLIRKHVSKSDLKKSDLLKALDESFGKGASKRFVLICKGANLTEIQVNLTASSLDPKTIESKITIKSLLNKSAVGYIRGCKDKIAIDRIGPN